MIFFLRGMSQEARRMGTSPFHSSGVAVSRANRDMEAEHMSPGLIALSLLDTCFASWLASLLPQINSVQVSIKIKVLPR